jgi:hypothetical protein
MIIGVAEHKDGHTVVTIVLHGDEPEIIKAGKCVTHRIPDGKMEVQVAYMKTPQDTIDYIQSLGLLDEHTVIHNDRTDVIINRQDSTNE